MQRNLQDLRLKEIYSHPDRYRKAISEINKLLVNIGRNSKISLTLTNYQDPSFTPLRSEDLLKAAENYQDNLFFPYFSKRLEELIVDTAPSAIGFSLNYLSQAITTFAMIGFVKRFAPELPLIVGGGLITSWTRNPSWNNPFGGLIDHLITGKGEIPLLRLAGIEQANHHRPNYSDLPLDQYLSPGFILPYAASSGCFWNKCSFCPEVAEDNPYSPLTPKHVLNDLKGLTQETQPVLIHFLDNALSPSTMEALVDGPRIPWYGFSRISRQLTDATFCRNLRKSGCKMLKLGIESGDERILQTMNKGIEPKMVSSVLTALKKAGIATYVYLLFGTPNESLDEARKTLSFVTRHHKEITFLNLAIFNMPVCSQEAAQLEVDNFYEGDLSLYSSFVHPRGWDRKAVRNFIDRKFSRHPLIAPILRRDPPHLTSNHAPFFCP